MIKAIFFDMDGTLVDSEKYYTDGTYNWMQRCGYLGSKEDIFPIIGTSMAVTYDIIYELLDSKISKEDIIKFNEDYFNVENPINYQEYVFEYVCEYLKKIKVLGYKMAICSSSYKKDINEFIKQCNLNDIFDLVISSHDCTKPKPDPEIYLKTLEILNIKNDEAIVIEDSNIGIKAAKDAKIFTIAKKEERFKIDQSNADMKINNLKELYRYLGELDNE